MLAVGLNALHLVPGETGGSELYARRLIGALAALEGSPRIVVFAPNEAVALARGRAMGGARRDRPRPGSRAPPRQARARRADGLAPRHRWFWHRASAQPLHDRARPAGRAAGDDDPRRDLQALPRGAWGPVELRHAPARPARRTALAPRAHALAGREGRHRPLPARARRQSRRHLPRPRASGGRDGVRRRRPPPARARRSADRAHGLREEAAQEPRAALRGVQRRSHGA